MNYRQSARQFGTLVVMLTMLFRLFQSGLPQQLLRQRKPPNSITQQRKTELPVRSLSFPRSTPLPFVVESPPPEQAEQPVFLAEEAEGLTLVNTSEEHPDLAALLTAPLDVCLTGDAPAVLILHTHTTESYTPDGETYAETADYRTLAEDYNMLAIGQRVARLLTDAGITVIHDRQLHDYPSYTGAYTHARKAAQAVIKENPSIFLVLDLHRDAADSAAGQLRTVAQTGGRETAQLMFVVGCGNAGLHHPDWEQNLSLALKLQCLLERESPGICRPISLRPQRFNQDLTPGALLVEVGAAGNTRAEALLAAECLADAVIALKNGVCSK